MFRLEVRTFAARNMRPRLYIDDTRQRIRQGHLWIYDNQVLRTEGQPEPGGIVQVFDVKKGPLGQAYYNPKSKLVARLITKDLDEPIDRAFFVRMIQAAWDHRRRMVDTTSCRVVFGEADGLPALVVDKFNDVLVIQTLALGMDRFKPLIVEALREVTGVSKLYERNDVPVREKEGLEQRTGFLSEPFDTGLTIIENDLALRVDIAHGQKTGHFLDQRQNHAAIARISKGARVLDCFTHTGGFALHAAMYGARDVLGLDISEGAVALAKRNAEANGLADRCRFITANVFDFLTEASKRGDQWDVVVLDPPSFAKSRGALEGAVRGYKEINLRALQQLAPGGILATYTCSHHMQDADLRGVLAAAATDAKRKVRVLEFCHQPPDHPVLVTMVESEYLRGYIVQAE